MRAIYFSMIIAFVGGFIASILYDLDKFEMLVTNILIFLTSLYLLDRDCKTDKKATRRK